jgi:hypothetical protein
MTIEQTIPPVTPPAITPPDRPYLSPDEVAFLYYRRLDSLAEVNALIAKPVFSTNQFVDEFGVMMGNDVVTDAMVLNKMIQSLSYFVDLPEYEGYDMTQFNATISAGLARLGSL